MPIFEKLGKTLLRILSKNCPENLFFSFSLKELATENSSVVFFSKMP